MCGIAGVTGKSVNRLLPNLQKMTDAISHRGPDGEGHLDYANCILGHRRLSIVDIEGGYQPMQNHDYSKAVTFNGEIYGYKDIRNTLQYPFSSHSDTEVLLALYERDGIKMLSHLPGMFSFALWDDQAQTLFAARDRFGEKPFYYAWGNDGELIFASEIKAILASGLIRPKIDKNALSHYLQKLYVPVNQTIFSNIYTLPPSHFLTLCEGNLKIQRYWQLPEPCDGITVDDAIERFRFLFSQAISKQMIADVEVAAFLSGGLDSSSVVAETVGHGGKLRTIAFGFTSGVDERPFARSVANLYGTEHLELEEANLDIPDLLLRMAKIFDEPFADSSNIPTWCICHQASKHVKAVLTGDGGDELFAGYDFWYNKFKDIPEKPDYSVLDDIALFYYRLLNRLGFQYNNEIAARRVRSGMVRRNLSIAEIHSNNCNFFSDNLLSQYNIPLSNPSPLPALFGGADDALRADLTAYMPGDILVKTDRASMSVGLELRSPFLDVDLASFLISLPVSLKMRDGKNKFLLRQAYEDKWPQTLRNRQKQGFGAPVSMWLNFPGMQDLRAHAFDHNRLLYSILPKEFLDKYTASNNYQTWILLTLSLWLEEYGHAIEF